MPATASVGLLLGHRYQRVGVIGRGATGTVYRAIDRLSRRRVALKSVAAEAGSAQDALDTSHLTQQSARAPDLLAREFRLLSGLRHPNVVASLDYGLDDAGRPFFTMDLQENACTLRVAAAEQPLAGKVALLVQLLHALAYLHQRGLVHRDVKPENALCAGGIVKLIDLGLTVTAAEAETDGGSCGTLAYAAPEVLRGGASRQQADLYAAGVVAYELFAGCHPFDVSSPAKLLQSVFRSAPDLDRAGIAPSIAPVLARLLARDPAERFDDARDVIAALGTALASASATTPATSVASAATESSSTRESFLHGAQLVGRDAELAYLQRALPDMPSEGPKAVLVGGESGAGKSRLLEELAVEAMVRGVRVLRGQALREGARPYEPWRGVLRLLVLLGDATEREASVLKDLVPDVGVLLGTEVAAAPELDTEATLVRLTRVVEALFRRCRQPILIVLEDLQWAGTESLKLFTRVQALAAELRILLVATYRSDERPALPSELPGAESLELSRLPESAIARLCASILGESNGGASTQAVSELIARESNGNAFLVLELMRTLADEAGGLARVAALPLSERRFIGGTAHLVRRRVDRLSADDRAFLQTAAVAGRELDLEVLARLHPATDVEAAASRAVEAAVLSAVQGRWWFAHDKLRDALIDALPEEERRAIHGKLARELAVSSPANAATLAHHFGAARDTEREREFSGKAGSHFVRSGAYHEAIPYLRRALVLTTPAAAPLPRAVLERQLGEALFRSGQLVEARASLAAALTTLGRPLPSTRGRLIAAILAEAAVQVGLRARRRAAVPALPVSEIARFEEAILVYTQLTRLAHHLNDEELVLHVTLSALNLSERGRLLAHHARLAAIMGAVSGILPVHGWAKFYFRVAQALSAKLGDPAIEAHVLAHRGYYEAGTGQWQECREHLERSMLLYDQVGDIRLWEESVSILAYASFFKGDIPRSRELYRALERSGEERLDAQITSWGLTNRLKVLVRTGRLAEVDELMQRNDALLVDGITKAVRDGVGVELELARGNLGAARAAAAAAARRLEESAPRSFMACSTYAAIPHALLTVWSSSRGHEPPAEARELVSAAARANRALGKIARVFPIAEPSRLLHAGTFEALRGRPERARKLWEKAARDASTRELPFEEALALTALARLPASIDREAKLERARVLFERMGVGDRFVPSLE